MMLMASKKRATRVAMPNGDWKNTINVHLRLASSTYGYGGKRKLFNYKIGIKCILMSRDANLNLALQLISVGD